MRYATLVFGLLGFALPIGAAQAQSAPAPAALTTLDMAALLKPTTQPDEIRDPVLSSEEELTADSILSAAPLAEKVTLKGRVMNEENEPLIGATVYVRGAGVAASTDAKGFYSLQVPAGVNKLLFSYGGYADKEIDASNYLPVNVSLAPQTTRKK
ncbi:carboxypeptidase-like regulatory domain-containing protein [Hymenobacter sp. J193]|uniref:carboxypeptidase-like regulatory domain-containing protein n=1 Tax=Hymenobacter sp. J193 TaxID=2898429 RepID=UPI0021515EF3|nr:carboxypeptidase-like regulatory domain-containing protein [Hymenobacter sp. J193]MCR5889623.1 carboxypeptidase-like regulatory domain-containing protein [Hymenobacter sp. J193]